VLADLGEEPPTVTLAPQQAEQIATTASAEQYGATIPTKSLLEAIDSLPPGRGHPAGTTDAFLSESRRESF
jgi:hypothetical protein